MSDDLSEEELAALRELCAGASPGPWRAMVEGRDHTSGDSFIMVGPENARAEDMYVLRDSRPASRADLDFIAAARNDLPRLLDELQRRRGEG